jgi:hypothetical protein
MHLNLQMVGHFALRRMVHLALRRMVHLALRGMVQLARPTQCNRHVQHGAVALHSHSAPAPERPKERSLVPSVR